ncbi:NUDIX hydrolase [Pseudomonas sp. NPDC090755]|uniref:NUDIX hydrolase n=1 Tax=Pseudomonas sp. NPDC090755 TaxID=3364481 RepID=UPI00383B84C9
MRERKSARLLVVSPEQNVLLFRFVHKDGALAGDDYWATPGGGLEEGETFHCAALRELREETGIEASDVGQPVAHRRFPLQLPCGEWVFSVEQFFVVRAQSEVLSRQGWTAHEVQVMADHRWWSADELRTTREQVWPESIVTTLENAGVFTVSGNPAS